MNRIYQARHGDRSKSGGREMKGKVLWNIEAKRPALCQSITKWRKIPRRNHLYMQTVEARSIPDG